MSVAIAGVMRRDEWTRQKLYQAKCSAQAAFRLSSRLEKALVSRVDRRSCIRIVRFCRSIWDVEISLDLGLPVTGIGSALLCQGCPAGVPHLARVVPEVKLAQMPMQTA